MASVSVTMDPLTLTWSTSTRVLSTVTVKSDGNGAEALFRSVVKVRTSVVPSTVARLGTRPSTNAIISYGPQSLLLTPGGNVPKSIFRPSSVSLIWSWIARIS